MRRKEVLLARSGQESEHYVLGVHRHISTSSSSSVLLLFRAAKISGAIFIVERGGQVFRGKV